MRRTSVPLVAMLVLVVTTRVALCDVRPAALFCDGLVLQRGDAVAVWGWADPGEAVTVSIDGRSVETAADDDGAWRVSIDPPEAGGPYTLTLTGKNTMTIEDVLVGDVWLASGQSNMAWPLRKCHDGAAETAKANHPKIRLFQTPRRPSTEPLPDVEAAWEVCAPESAADFSGVAYYFGQALRRHLDVPIGLIEADRGGSPSEAWTSREVVASHEAFEPTRRRWKTIIENYPKARETYHDELRQWRKQPAIAAWIKEVRAARAEGKQPPRAPAEPRRPWRPLGPEHPIRPSNLFNGMLHPLIPYTVRGVIWYQGESNAGRARQYRTIFPLMIEDWRTRWGAQLPFLFVQNTNYGEHKDAPTSDKWAALREAQSMAHRRVPRTAMVVSIDCGQAEHIHGRFKKPIGRRLALAARGLVYGEDIVYSGPIYKGMTKKDGRIRLAFDHAHGGLMAGREGEADALTGFGIAGADRQFVWAKARIDGDEVVVWSEEVPDPVAVRYAWQRNPRANLYNKEGLPASPFRTDEWPLRW